MRSLDVFLCHNSEDKPAVRELAQMLSEENIKPWLDEVDIRAGSFWHVTIGRQIETVKAAAVFIGQHGVGPWQHLEIVALLDQFDRRGCPVIPVILVSAPAELVLPWSLVGLHCVDFRATDSYPLGRLIWGITGNKPTELSNVPASEKPATMRDAVKGHLLPPRGDDHVTTYRGAFSDLEISKARHYPPLAEAPDREQGAQLEILRRRVMEYWVEGVLRHSLHNEVLLSLGKRPIDTAVDAPWKYMVEVSDAANSARLDDRDVSAIYDATGLLLILGEPGSGKTTILLDLARTLLERARDDLKERVPVVLNLSSWKKNQPLAEWISGELSDKYRVPRKIARFWLVRDYLLPLLDGLDEVETLLQPDCVAAINAFIEESNPSGLVVCCRFNEYQWLPERLKLNGAICLEPLSPEEVSKYLDQSGSKLAALRETVNSDLVLQELAQTPLMLSIMSLACQGAAGNELARRKAASAEERRKQIFGLYVERMFLQKGTASDAFPKEKVIGWLSWLSQKMKDHSESVFLVEGLQPSWLGTGAQRAAYTTVVPLSLGLIGWFLSGLGGASLGNGLVIGLGVFAGVGIGCLAKSRGDACIASVLFSVLTSGLIGSLLQMSPGEVAPDVGGAALIGGLIGIVGISPGPPGQITPVETMTWRWNQFWKSIIPSGKLWPWAIILAFFFIFSIFSAGLKAGLITWLVGLFVVGPPILLIWLIIGLARGFTDTVKTGKASSNEGIKLSRKNALVAFLFSCVIVWLLVGLIFGLLVGITQMIQRSLSSKETEELVTNLNFVVKDWGLIFGLRSGLVGGLLFGLIGGLNRGGYAVIQHYALRLILWRKGYTPFDFIKFLDHCARLILLKKVGGGYIFIHRMLLEYFAELTPQELRMEKRVSRAVAFHSRNCCSE